MILNKPSRAMDFDIVIKSKITYSYPMLRMMLSWTLNDSITVDDAIVIEFNFKFNL